MNGGDVVVAGGLPTSADLLWLVLVVLQFVPGFILWVCVLARPRQPGMHGEWSASDCVEPVPGICDPACRSGIACLPVGVQGA